jgi:hypothetical protein
VQKQAQISPLCRSALTAYLPAAQPTAQTTSTRKFKSKSSAKSSVKRGKGPINLDPNAR